MTEPLSPIERKVYHYLIDFLAENTYQPSIREIGRKFRIKSTKTVSDLLHSLSEKGFIQRDPSRSRGVRIVGYNGPAEMRTLRSYDHAASGAPTGQIAVDRRFIGGDDAFVLRVAGDSLRSLGVLAGDHVVVSPSVAPGSEDLVAVQLGAETSVRTFASVEAATGALAAIPDVSRDGDPMAAAFAVLGTVTGVLRATAARPTLDGAIAE